MRTWTPALILIAGIALSACGSDEPAPPSAMNASTDEGQSNGFGSIAGQATTERMIVRDAELQLAFDDVRTGAEAIEDVAEAQGGRVQSSRITGEGSDARGTVAVRVPSENFSRAIDDIKALAQRVETEESNSADVTDEFVDLDAQVRNLQVTEVQLQTLMDRATTVSDVLNVQRELTTIRGQIERHQGRMQLLSQTAAESLITVTLVPTESARPIADDSWSFMDTLRSAARGLLATLQVVVNIGTWVIVLSPIWLPAVALFWFGRRKHWFGPRPGTYGARAVTPPAPPPPAPPPAPADEA